MATAPSEIPPSTDKEREELQTRVDALSMELESQTQVSFGNLLPNSMFQLIDKSY